MLRLVDQIVEVVGTESLAQLTEASGQMKLVVRDAMGQKHCATKANQEVIDRLEGEILNQIRHGKSTVRADVENILNIYEKYQQYFVTGFDAGLPILDLLKIAPDELKTKEGMAPLAVLYALVGASRSQIKKISGKKVNGDNALHQDLADNALRLGLLVPPVSYNELHQSKIYRFMDNLEPNAFARTVADYRNGPKNNEPIVQGKTILVLGSGNGRDDIEFVRRGASKVTAVDRSYVALQKIRENLENSNLGQKRKGKLIIPQTPGSMMDVLEEMAGSAQKVDTIYSCSTMHYDGPKKFKRTVKFIRNCLTDGGHFVFAIKLPGAAFDGEGEGIKLVEDISKPDDKDKRSVPRVYERAWLNRDGQIRHFRDTDSILRLIEESNLEGEPNTTKLHVMLAGSQEVEEYDVAGQPQRFGIFILKKVAA